MNNDINTKPIPCEHTEEECDKCEIVRLRKALKEISELPSKIIQTERFALVILDMETIAQRALQKSYLKANK